MDDAISRSAVLENARTIDSFGFAHLHYEGIMVVDVDDINDLPALDAVPVVRCGECAYYKKPHVLTNDGEEKSYEEMPPEAFDGLDDMYVTMKYGINVGGKCMLDCGRGYPEDKSVFRSPNDFCSYGTAGIQTDEEREAAAWES